MIQRRIWRECLSWGLVLLPMLILLLLTSKVFAVTVVQQESMKPALTEGDVLFSLRDNFAHRTPRRGEVVLFYADHRERKGLMWEVGMRFVDISDRWRTEDNRLNTRYVKRVVGLPGEMLDIRDGLVYIDGEALKEPWTVNPTTSRVWEMPVRVPEGMVFLLGDNRQRSEDSRDFGPVPFGSLEARIWKRLYPFANYGSID